MTSRIIVAIVAVFAVLSLAAPVDAEAGQRSMLREPGIPCDVGLSLDDTRILEPTEETPTFRTRMHWSLSFLVEWDEPDGDYDHDHRQRMFDSIDIRFNVSVQQRFTHDGSIPTRPAGEVIDEELTDTYELDRDFLDGRTFLRERSDGPPDPLRFMAGWISEINTTSDTTSVEIVDVVLQGDVRCVGSWIRYLRQ